VRLAAWTLALDRALQARGVTATDSRTPPGWRFTPVGSDGTAVDITHCPIAA
jgi:hypothetical protein